MASGFGVDPTLDTNGNPTSGTTSDDIRNIYGGVYSAPGVVSGGNVTTSASAMTYSVSAGVAVISTSAGQNVLVPIPAATVTTAAAPSSGSRTDIVYAQQHFPTIEGDSNVVIGVGQTLPARAVALKSFTVPSGILNTNGTTVTGSVDYAIPAGTSRGYIYTYVDTFDGVVVQSDYRLGIGTINLPTDRLLRIAITSCMSAQGASGFDNSKYCEWYYTPEIDYASQVWWTTGGLHQAWAIFHFETYITVAAGQHTVSYRRGREVGPGTGQTHYGTSNGHFYPGTVFTVMDCGVAP